MSNKITYGLSNVHVWPITSTNASGVPTYGAIIAVPGAVELTMDAEGSSDPFYADDTIYYQGVANNGYTGSITIADIPESILTNVLGETTDTNGAIIENTDTQPKEFAIAFEFKGDQNKRRYLFWRCMATRPSVSSKTKESSIEPNTNELPLTAMPRLDTGDVKARCEQTDACYAGWYGTAPYQGTTTTATISLSSATLTVAEDATASLTADVSPAGLTVAWTSTDTSIASVSSGTVTGVAEGTCSIIASITYNGVTYSAACTVTVTA